MTQVVSNLRNIIRATFRANPAFELVVYNRLLPEQQELVRNLLDSPGFYGLLIPRTQDGLTIKSLDQDTALLFLTLQAAGTLPTYLTQASDAVLNQGIAQLVLDAILQIEWNDRFVSGADAIEALYHSNPASLLPQTKIAQLSIAALQYIQAIDEESSLRISSQLYFFNRIPASAIWLKQFPTPESIATYLGLRGDSAPRQQLWNLSRTESETQSNSGWHMWFSKSVKQPIPTGVWTYKLYVSPHPSYMKEAFDLGVRVFGETDAHAFKVGNDIFGLLRPDKFIGYFYSLDNLKAAAQKLGQSLSGMQAHGVPFTAELGGDGLLSWGMDPPPDKANVAWQERESWRLWVTNRLAVALSSAKHAQQKMLAPWQFALQRMQFENVDVATWTPLNMSTNLVENVT